MIIFVVILLLESDPNFDKLNLHMYVKRIIIL